MIAFICMVEGIVRWNSDRSRSYLFIGFAILITIVFFFKRHFRKKIEKRNSQNKEYF
jgi:uncharacterized membrane protein YuzA (DUF378 family)